MLTTSEGNMYSAEMNRNSDNKDDMDAISKFLQVHSSHIDKIIDPLCPVFKVISNPKTEEADFRSFVFKKNLEDRYVNISFYDPSATYAIAQVVMKRNLNNNIKVFSIEVTFENRNYVFCNGIFFCSTNEFNKQIQEAISTYPRNSTSFSFVFTGILYRGNALKVESFIKKNTS